MKVDLHGGVVVYLVYQVHLRVGGRSLAERANVRAFGAGFIHFDKIFKCIIQSRHGDIPLTKATGRV